MIAPLLADDAFLADVLTAEDAEDAERTGGREGERERASERANQDGKQTASLTPSPPHSLSPSHSPSLSASSASSAVNTSGRGFRLWWLGQSGFLVQWRGQHLLLDPYLSDSLTRKYAETDKPHVRMTARVIAPERLDFIDVTTSSHNHTDHLDAETLGPLLRVNPAMELVIPEANRAFVAERLGIEPSRPLGVDDGTTLQAAGFQLTGIPAAHEAIDRDAAGRCHYLGYLVRFGPWTIYHSGDTLWYEGMAERLRPASIDVALLPINGSKPERRVAGNLNGVEAARLAKEIGARLVIPCHYEMFAFNTASPDGFVAECERLGQPYRVLRCGEGWDGAALERQRKASRD